MLQRRIILHILMHTASSVVLSEGIRRLSIRQVCCRQPYMPWSPLRRLSSGTLSNGSYAIWARMAHDNHSEKPPYLGGTLD